MVERVHTGIPGLDDLMEGGLPARSVTLVSGGAGCGKTIFCSQFLWHGLEEGEHCLFVTLEENPDEILEDAHEFGWDFSHYEENGAFEILYINPFKDAGGFIDRIRTHAEDLDADRVVIDSTSVMGMYGETTGEVRERLYDLIRKLREHKVTTIMTSEIPRGSDEQISRYGVEEFVADAVIILHYMSIGAGIYRNIEIPKIRKTNQKKGTFPMMISSNGINVFEDEDAYAKAQRSQS